MERPKRVAIYARVSSADQAKRDLSVPEQIRQVEEFCSNHGWTVVDRFTDPGKSGAETVNRPGLQKMLKAALSKERPFDLILTREQSRFGRSDQDAAIRQQLRQHGVAVSNITASPTDMESAITSASAFMERVYSAVDIYAREHQAELMKAGQKAKARKGGLPGAQATCYGYTQKWVSVNGGKPVRTPIIDKAKAKIVREMFRRYSRGASLRSITKWLNESGLSAPRGVVWYEPTVRQILANETYLGRAVYGRLKKVKHPKTRTLVNAKNDGEVIRVDNAFPAIIDHDTFDRVQAILSSNENTKPQGGHPGNTLRGVGKCAVCGWHLAHQRHSSTGRWYYSCGSIKTKGRNSDPGCKGNLYANYVDEVVEQFLKFILSEKVTSIRAQVARYNNAATKLVGLSATEPLEIAIAEQQSKVGNLVTAISKGSQSPAVFKALESAEAKLTELQRKHAELAATVKVPSVNLDEVLEARSEITSALRKGDTRRMRAILAALCSVVRCDWRNRKDPAVSFTYLYEEPVPEHFSETELRQFAKARKKFRDTASNPLIFVPKWSIFTAERASEDAMQQLAEALN